MVKQQEQVEQEVREKFDELGDNPFKNLYEALAQLAQQRNTVFEAYQRPVVSFVAGDSDRVFRASDGGHLMLHGYANGEAWVIEYAADGQEVEWWNTRYLAQINFKDDTQ